MFDIKGIEKLLELNVNEAKFGYNKEENKIIIENIDNSTKIQYKNEIGLSIGEILTLPPEDIGNFIKHKTILSLKAALKDKPDEMGKIISKYNPALVATTASSISIASSKGLKDETPIPSGDFINQLQKAIETGPYPKVKFVEVGESEGVAADWEQQNDHK